MIGPEPAALARLGLLGKEADRDPDGDVAGRGAVGKQTFHKRFPLLVGRTRQLLARPRAIREEPLDGERLEPGKLARLRSAAAARLCRPEALAAALRELAAYPPLVPAARRTRSRRRSPRRRRAAPSCSRAAIAPRASRNSQPTISSRRRPDRGHGAKAAGAASGLPVIRLGRIAGQFAKPRSAASSGGAAPCPSIAATSSTADRLRRNRPPSRPGADVPRLRPVGGDAQPYRDGRRGRSGLDQPRGAAPPLRAGAGPRRDGAGWYGSSAHFLWIGDRTRFDGSAHVELLRGLANPIGIKCGPDARSGDLLLRLLDRIDPAARAGPDHPDQPDGRGRVAEALPPLAARGPRRGAAGAVVLRSDARQHDCARPRLQDPAARSASSPSSKPSSPRAGRKACAGVGLHIEMTGRDVTECTGGAAG
jgi:3-deoxy-7-phosphoheptulonate synthase